LVSTNLMHKQDFLSCRYSYSMATVVG